MVLSATHKAFFLWVLKFKPQDLPKMLAHRHSEVRGGLEPLVMDVQALNPDQIKEFALRELKKFERSFEVSYLPQVHNDWLVLALKNESGPVISSLLRHMPSDRVRAIISQLPLDLLAELPKLGASYNLDEALTKTLKRRFEKQFPIKRVKENQTPFEFKEISHLNGAELKKLFCALGYAEMAMGLNLLPEPTQKLVLGKLPIKDKQAVAQAIKALPATSETRFKKAQWHIVNQPVHSMDDFVFEMGVSVFAKAVLPEDQWDVQVMAHKLSYKEGSLLLDQVLQSVSQNTKASVLGYQEEVLKHCRLGLGSKNKVH